MTTETNDRPVYTPLADDDLAFRFGPEVDVEDGEYPARLVDLGTVMVNWDGEDRERVRWDFALDDFAQDDDGRPVTLAGWSSRSTGERSTARRWLAALVGAEGIANGVSLRKSDVVGRPCRIVVVHDDRGYPKVDLVMAPKRT